MNRPTRITDARGGITELAYDARDNLIRVTDPEHSTTRFEYDAHDRLVREIRPEGETRAFTYYPGGLRESETNGEGQVIHYDYNDAGELTTTRHFADAGAKQDDQPGRTVTFEYNDLGLLSAYDDGTTSGTYDYDLLGRLTGVTVDYGPFTKAHAYTYDRDGRKATYTNPEGITYEYAYTAEGRFEAMTVPGEGTIAVTGRRWHEPVGWQFPGGTRVHADVDGLLRPRDTRLLDPGDNERARRQYQYNLENHIIALQTESGEHIYDYDRLYRLIQAEYEQKQLRDEAYTYDGVGNRLTENGEGPWQYNKNHQLLEIPDSAAGDGQEEGEDEPSAGTTFDYDRNGHTVRKEEPDGTVTLYEYDLAERLRRVKIEGGPVLGTYEYDPFGRRVSKTTAEGTVYFHYDDSGLLAEYDSSGNLVSEYQYRPNSPWIIVDPEIETMV